MPETKPDTVELSTKKKVATTGIGAIFGGVIGGIKGKFSDKNLPTSEDIEAQIRQGKEKIFTEFRDKLATTYEKVASGAVLSEEEKSIAHDFCMDNPLIDLVLKGCWQKQLAGSTRKAKSFEDITKDIGGNISADIGHLQIELKHRITGFFEGKYSEQENKELLDVLGDDFKKAYKEAYVKYEGHPFAMWGALQKDADKAINAQNWTYEGQNCEKKYCSKLYQQLEENIENSIKKTKTKNIIKSAGIGAAIVGGVALAGTLIYSHIKNKDNNKA